MQELTNIQKEVQEKSEKEWIQFQTASEWFDNNFNKEYLQLEQWLHRFNQHYNYLIPQQERSASKSGLLNLFHTNSSSSISMECLKEEEYESVSIEDLEVQLKRMR